MCLKCGVQRTTFENLFSFPTTWVWDQTQVFRLSEDSPHPRIHLTRPQVSLHLSFIYLYLSVSVCTRSQRTREYQIPWSCAHRLWRASLCGREDLNLGAQREEYVLLSAEPSWWPSDSFFRRLHSHSKLRMQSGGPIGFVMLAF